MDKQENKPTLDEILKNNPPKPAEDIEYPDEDEEEEMDTTFLLEPWEEKYYDEDGNFIEDDEKEGKE